jgi:hypothetical protein
MYSRESLRKMAVEAHKTNTERYQKVLPPNAKDWVIEESAVDALEDQVVKPVLMYVEKMSRACIGKDTGIPLTPTVVREVCADLRQQARN